MKNARKRERKLKKEHKPIKDLNPKGKMRINLTSETGGNFDSTTSTELGRRKEKKND